MSESPNIIPRSIDLVSHPECRLVVVDVQEKLLPVIPDANQLTHRIRQLLQAARLFEIPLYCSEQYPKGLGSTVPELADLLPAPREKLRFSATACLGWETAANTVDSRTRIVLTGIEAHICVQQTALDLLAAGYRVIIPVDAIASRNQLDWETAIRRMENSGACITTTESILFEWCEVAGTPEFKQISRLVTEKQ
ncbi:isochorismatase family protein [Gimesia maris]|uniref:isochorismatase family protein n=1 Tax=Gimesia maris TaxID=122 RepID=UPI00241E8724|nr:isochorismatase family protein [Gimesia maris]|tara:strand:+ start:187383 stop:187967 length:585 start_codon:yes stop_codon:yes gene_type:complete